MRVALFHNLPPGGARRAAFELVRAGAGRHQFDLYTVDMGDSDRFSGDTQRARQDIASLAHASYVYPLPMKGLRRIRGLGDVARALDLRAVLQVHRTIAVDIDGRGYDLALVHHDQLTQAPRLLQTLQTPSVYYLQEPRRQTFEYAFARRRRPATGVGRAKRRLEAWFEHRVGEIDIRSVRGADVIAVNSYYSVESVYRAYGRYAVVSYLGVDTDTFTTDGDPPSREGVLTVGAMHPAKGHDLVVEAVARMPAPRPPVTVVYERELPGETERLRQLSTDEGVELRLVRSIDDETLAELYRTSVATICAASLEPFGLTALESLACGTPVVAVREGGFREVVTSGLQGRVVDRSPAAIAAAIAEVATDAAGGALERRASVVPFWTWTSAAERLDDVMQAAMEGRTLP